MTPTTPRKLSLGLAALLAAATACAAPTVEVNDPLQETFAPMRTPTPSPRFEPSNAVIYREASERCEAFASWSGYGGGSYSNLSQPHTSLDLTAYQQAYSDCMRRELGPNWNN